MNRKPSDNILRPGEMFMTRNGYTVIVISTSDLRPDEVLTVPRFYTCYLFKYEGSLHHSFVDDIQTSMIPSFEYCGYAPISIMITVLQDIQERRNEGTLYHPKRTRI